MAEGARVTEVLHAVNDVVLVAGIARASVEARERAPVLRLGRDVDGLDRAGP